jgi:hypothetical protein
MNETQDSIVNSVIKKIIERSDLEIVKYERTLDKNNLQSIEWLNHLQEELMDEILYSEKFKKVKLKKD